MAFTMPDYPLLSGRQVNPFADLVSNALQGYASAIEAKYKPLTVPAKAMSEMAYASFVQPQFISKLLSNPAIAANLSKEQLNQALNISTGGGSFGYAPNPYIPNVMQNNQSPVANQPTQARNQPAYSGNQSYGYGTGETATPQEVNQFANNAEEKLGMPPKRDQTFSEKAGEYERNVARGKELGKQEGETIAEYGKIYRDSNTRQQNYNEITSLINNPVFRSVRQSPIAQGAEMAYLSKTGTPEQQQVIGQFIEDSKKYVADTMNSFQGRKFARELPLTEKMAVTESDTLNAMIGKIKAASYYNQYTKRVADLVTDLMHGGYTEKEALKIASQTIDTAAIKKEIENSLDYTVQVRNARTGQVENMPISHARRLKGLKNAL